MKWEERTRHEERGDGERAGRTEERERRRGKPWKGKGKEAEEKVKGGRQWRRGEGARDWRGRRAEGERRGSYGEG